MKFVTEKSYPDALDALVAKLRRAEFSPDRYTIVLTPDRYTLSVEKALFTGRAALDCEVLTLSRLCRRVLEGKALSREGGVMLTARAVAAAAPTLAYYSHAAAYTDFAREVFETLLQFGSSCADISGIPAKGVTKRKLDDLAKIKAEYDRLKEDCLDATDRLEALIAAAADSELIRSSDIYAIGYADATRLNRRVFEAIGKAARSFTFIDAYPPESAACSEVWKMQCAVDQYKFIAARIREYVYKGGSYEDVAVVCPEPKALSRILREYGIAFHTDNETALFDTPPLRAIYSAYRLASQSSAADLVALCKNPYSSVATEDAERLYAYLISHRIEYGVFNCEITDAAAARAVKRAEFLVSKMRGDFSDAALALMDAADFEGVSDRLKTDVNGIAGDDDLILTDMITPVRELAELVKRYGSAGEGSFDEDAAAFFSAARAVEVKSLPRYRDRVAVCMPSSLRFCRTKLLFIADFNEGVMPVTTSDCGLLSDAELIKADGAVEPTVREKNRRERAELAAVMANAKKVVCTYHTAGGTKKSSFLSAITEAENDYSRYLDGLRGESAPEYVARLACCKSAAREIAARDMTVYTDALYAAVGVGKQAQPFSERVNVKKSEKISVSELTDWFSCPYKRFLSDAIGLKERKDGSLSAPDLGTIIHLFMKKFLSGGSDMSDSAIAKTLDESLAECGISVNTIERDRLIAAVTDYAAANVDIIEAGEYRPRTDLTEYSFGGDVLLGSRGVPLVGFIDRVDEADGAVRVIDYKTGAKKFSRAKCENGSDMQLPLYAAELREKGMNVTGMFYIPMRSQYSADRAMSGCVIDDMGVLKGYDGKLGSGRSEIVPVNVVEKGGALCHKNKSDDVMSRDEFEKLIDDSIATASRAVDEMDGGYIARAPLADACRFCAFGGLCDDKKQRTGKSEEEEA